MDTITKTGSICQYLTSCSKVEALLPPCNVGGGEATSLPCLYNNNSTENVKESPEKDLVNSLLNLLSPYHKRAAETLYRNVARLVDLAPSINHIGFVTLTFKDNVTDAKEANRRFDSFNTHYLKPSKEFGEWVRVMEPQKRGAWHYHLIVILTQDIRTGINFEEIAQGKYSSTSPHLKKLWSSLRMNLPKYGFGRSELHPIRSTQEAMARYVGKYISKGLAARSDAQKGVRLVAYSQGWLKNSIRFQWHTPGSQLYRKKLAHFCASHGCTETYQLADKLGPAWQYKNAQIIMALPDDITEQQTLEAYDNAFKFHSPTLEKIEKRTYEEWKKKDKRKQKTNSWHNPCPF